MDLTSRYSSVDRLIHRLAFSTARLQIDLADLEDTIFRKDLAGREIRRPVFVTALPRAGTTLLLQLTAALDEFASHSYRDMPFVLLPLLWNTVSRNFQKSDVPTERAHGDGVMVSVDSAEAFEEMVWRALWPDHYKSDRIVPWSRCDNAEAAATFINHLKKVIKLRQRDPNVVPRYLSKNNTNVSRIGALLDICPDALVVVPVRDPLQHAASLVRTHRRLLEMQARDPFAREYMEGVGHFDFGASLRPIDFGGWLANARHTDNLTIGFWLEYWVAAYKWLHEHNAERVHFLPYDRFCAQPEEGMRWFAELLDIRNRDAFIAQAHMIRVPAAHAPDLSGVAPDVLAQANELYAQLSQAGFRQGSHQEALTR